MRRRLAALAAEVLTVTVAALLLGGAGAAEAANPADGLVAAQQRLRDGDYAGATEILVALAEEQPEAIDVHTLLGRALVLDRQFLAAEDALARAVELGSVDVATLLYLGATRWENGRLDAAEATFQRAVGLAGGTAAAREQLGRLYLWQGRYDEAVPLLRSAAARRPAVDVETELAQALAGAGEVAEAAGLYRQLAARAPENRAVRYGLARALGRLGDEEGAALELAAFQRLYAEDQRRTREEGTAAARLAVATDLIRRGEAAAAVTHLESLPETVDVLAALAVAHGAAGDEAAALVALERAVARDPSRTDLRARLTEARLAEQSR